MKVLIVVLAIGMLSIIGCSNDNDARVQELEQVQAVPSMPTATPTTTATDASVMPNTLQATNFQILDRHPNPKLDCINDSMDVFLDVFGVVVIATNSAPLPFVLHTAGVLAQFLDNDEDGVPDEPNVLD